MIAKRLKKIRNKGTSYWRHGKHYGLKEISIIFNRRKKFVPIFEPIDIRNGNWSCR